MRRRAQGGQVLVVFALLSVAFFGFAALAIDGGRLVIDQRGLQNAADGAALTGALDIGPGINATASGNGEDDAVYALEQSLNISFSKNYSGVGHRLLGGATSCAPSACNSSTTPVGPFNPSSGASPCCNNWVSNDGAYTLTITTPYSYSSQDPEAFIYVDVIHQLPLVMAGFLFKTIAVEVTATARNQALGYSIFAFKRNDTAGISSSGSSQLRTNKRAGTNGSASANKSLGFICNASNQYGGDLYQRWQALNNQINASLPSVHEGSCPSPGTASQYIQLGDYQRLPRVDLPPDPCLQAGVSCAAPLAPFVAPAGLSLLTPTRSSDPTRPYGPRYTGIRVPGSSTLLLQPGIYFFEGTGSVCLPAGSSAPCTGLDVESSGAAVATGDCYLQSLPNCSASTAIANGVCNPAATFTPALGGVGKDINFHCTADRDFGALLIFWPAGPTPDQVPTSCTNTNPNAGGSPSYFCNLSGGVTTLAANLNRLQITGQGSIYLTSSPKYHNVGVFVDNAHGSPSGTLNLTDAASLAAAGCSTLTCANQIGLGSAVIFVEGGSSISVNGAMFAPEDNLQLAGGASGGGYGQLLAYTINFAGNAVINQSFNPLALAYNPVLVK